MYGVAAFPFTPHLSPWYPFHSLSFSLFLLFIFIFYFYFWLDPRQIHNDNDMNARTRRCGRNSCEGQANLVVENPGTHNYKQRTLGSVGTAVVGTQRGGADSREV